MTIPQHHPLTQTVEFLDTGLDVMVRDPRDWLHHLTGTSAALWTLIDGRSSTEQIIGDLGEIYDTTPDSIRDDVERALTELAEAGLLAAPEVDDQPSAPDIGVDQIAAVAMPRPPDP